MVLFNFKCNPLMLGRGYDHCQLVRFDQEKSTTEQVLAKLIIFHCQDNISDMGKQIVPHHQLFPIRSLCHDRLGGDVSRTQLQYLIAGYVIDAGYYTWGVLLPNHLFVLEPNLWSIFNYMKVSKRRKPFLTCIKSVAMFHRLYATYITKPFDKQWCIINIQVVYSYTPPGLLVGT